MFFRRNIRFSDLTKMDLQIIENIDNARLYEDDYFRTPFGLAQLKHLSTGCKSVLNVLHYPDRMFSFAECGGNAIGELASVDESIGLNASIYLPRYREIEPFTAVMLDDIIIQDCDAFYSAWYGDCENA